MRKMFTIALLRLRMSFSSPGSLALMFVVPLMLSMIFGAMTGSSQSGARGHIYRIAVVDNDGGFASKALVEALQKDITLDIRMETEAALDKRFSDKQIEAGVVIPKGFTDDVARGGAPEVKLVAPPGGNMYLGVGPAVERETTRVARDYRMALAATGGAPAGADVSSTFNRVAVERKAVTTNVVVQTAERAATGSRISRQQVKGLVTLGFVITFVMMAAFSGSGIILAERHDGTWGRLLTTPTPRVVVIGGYLLNVFLTGMLQFAILVVVTRLVYGIDWGPIPQLTVMAAATVLCAGGMGLFLAGIVRTHEQQATVGILFVNATSMLGGVYWDLSFVSDTMRRIGYLTPQAWALDGFREVMLRGGSWGALLTPLGILLGITAVFLTAGLLRVRYE